MGVNEFCVLVRMEEDWEEWDMWDWDSGEAMGEASDEAEADGDIIRSDDDAAFVGLNDTVRRVGIIGIFNFKWSDEWTWIEYTCYLILDWCLINEEKKGKTVIKIIIVQ